jgi:hypothetical protein
MATRADRLKAQTQIENSEKERKPVGVKRVPARVHEKWNTLGRKTKRAVHAGTKSKADAKAGKPGDGKKVARWRTGPNGGEDQTTNGVRTGRGADGLPGKTPSRKSTRGAWPAGEKRVAPLTSRVKARVHSPEARAARRK